MGPKRVRASCLASWNCAAESSDSAGLDCNAGSTVGAGTEVFSPHGSFILHALGSGDGQQGSSNRHAHGPCPLDWISEQASAGYYSKWATGKPPLQPRS